MEVKIQLFNNSCLPTKATQYAGAWDVYCSEIIPGENGAYICKLGFAVELPQNYRLMFAPRSSITKTNLVLQNTPAIGDEDFRGEYQLRFKSIPIIPGHGKPFYPAFPWVEGDRIGQCWIETVTPIEFEVVEKVTPTLRGAYGSTGR